MKRAILIGMIILLVAGGIYAGTRYLPFPGTAARVATGERIIVQDGDRQITYFARGRGPRVMLAASAGREASDFNELTTRLAAAGYRTLAVEAAGIGGSSMRIDEPTLIELASDLGAVLAHDRALRPQAPDGLARIGHAFGNRLVRVFADTLASPADAVILIAAGGQKPIPEAAARHLRLVFDPRRSRAEREIHVREAFFADGNEIPEYWMRGWHADAALLQRSAIEREARKAEGATDWHNAGGAPMLILQAEADTVAPREDAGDELVRRFPEQAEMVIIENAGHALLPEAPDEITGAIIGFLNENL
ncbi:MAG: alpha/beta hydrolase [Pacificimonas sp.]